MSLRRIPDHVILFVLEFLDAEESASLISCCKDWYHSPAIKRNVQKLSLLFVHSSEGWIEKVLRLIADPSRQLNLAITEIPNYTLIDFLTHVHYRLNVLHCESMLYYLNLIHFIESLTVTELIIFSANEQSASSERSDDFVHSFSKVSGCQSLALYYDTFTESSMFPFLPSLRTLQVSNFGIQSHLTNYSKTLHQLSLHHCDISDVSMLGSIPDLVLKSCHDIIDISALNNNLKIIVENCKKIQDYSQSFANSIVIFISISEHIVPCCFDITRWSKVETLVLDGRNEINDCIFRNSNQLPKTVKRCFLSRRFVSLIDFTVTSDHAVHELGLSNDKYLTSIEGYGFEKVAVIELEDMETLQSLEGLGRERNRKVTISDCDLIRDFSPLNHLPIVKIKDCAGFKHPLHLRSVRDLSITPVVEFSFQCELNLHNPYGNMQSLSLSNTKSILKSFDGLETIPYLQIDIDCHVLMKSFLSNGGQLQNQRIVLLFYYNSNVEQKELLDLHHEFMKDAYDYYSQYPKKWTWFRKN